MSSLDTISIDRVQRKQRIRTAEGYLDLIMVFDDRWPLDLPLRQQMAERAIEVLEAIKNPLGHKPYVLFLKGQACRACDRHKEAIHYLKQSAQLDPENIHVFLALAWSYKRTGRIEQAIEAMKNAVDLDSSSAIAQYNLACYFALANDTPNAILHLSLAFELDADFRCHVSGESDFDNIRDDPRFMAITSVVA